MLYDPKAFLWMDNPTWYRKVYFDDGRPDVVTDKQGHEYHVDHEFRYELTDEAPEEARKSFERFKLFSQLTCDDAFEPSPAYEAYQAYVEREDSESE